MRIERIAMIVGIDDYELQNCSLDGCVNDAMKIREVLLSHYDRAPNFDCTKTFTSDQYTIDSQFLLKEAESFFNLEAQVALFYFSGHGFLNNLGGYLVTQDAKAYREGIKMDDILIMASNARAERRIQEIVIILDCCHSGVFGESPKFKDMSVLQEGISILAASRKYESAVEINGEGRFTKLIVNALKGGASDFCGEIKVPSIYAYIDDALSPVEQRPIFKSNVSKLISLRNSDINIELSFLRFLPEYFKSFDDQFSLDSTFLPNNENSNEINNKKFFHLLLFQDRQLIKTTESFSLEIAAENEESCTLTELGKYYWRLINERQEKIN